MMVAVFISIFQIPSHFCMIHSCSKTGGKYTRVQYDAIILNDSFYSTVHTLLFKSLTGFFNVSSLLLLQEIKFPKFYIHRSYLLVTYFWGNLQNLMLFVSFAKFVWLSTLKCPTF